MSCQQCNWWTCQACYLQAEAEQNEGHQPSAPPEEAGNTYDGRAIQDGSEHALELQAVESQLRQMMNRPIDERKKFFRDLTRKYHPDRNSQPYAQEVSQFLNGSRSWFL